MFARLKALFEKKPKPSTWRHLSSVEKDDLIEELIAKLDELDQNNELLIKELGELAAYCDKCEGNKLQYCMKCNGTGIVKKNRLMDWPWQ